MVNANASECQRSAANASEAPRTLANAGEFRRSPANSGEDPRIPGRDWSQRPEKTGAWVMGIVNVTDDSFSGDGLRGDPARAIAQAHAQVEAGADLIDLGAESTRPGAAPVSAQQEIDRLLPVLEGLRDLARDGRRVPVSVDTRRAAVMRAAAAAGAAILNDISALRGVPDEPGAGEADSLAAAAESGLPVVLMHMQGEPGTMQQAPHYGDVVAEVHDFLAGRIAACEAAGIPRRRIILDPGFGFGKTLAHNTILMRGLARLHDLGCPLLVGVSRKSMIGGLTGEAVPARRVAGSIAAGLHAVARGGAHILRVHDVAETVQALRAWRALESG